MPMWMVTVIVLLAIWLAGSVAVVAGATWLMRREPRAH
jgi:hypothetical protein